MTEKKAAKAKKEKVKKPETVETTPAIEPVTDEAAEAKKSEKKAKKEAVKAKKTKKPSKRYSAVRLLVDKTKTYSLDEAVALAKKTATIKFDGAVEVHVHLGIDTKKTDQFVRGAVTLPHGTGKTLKVVAFVAEGKENDAKHAGADVIGGADLINEIKQTGKIDFDVAVATPDMMPKLAMIAKILGPKGLMPSPKNETITTNLGKTIEELKKGKVNFKNDDTGNIHNVIGRVSFDEKKLSENFNAFINAVRRAKPASAKGQYIKTLSINATMGPGIRVSIPA